jgi:small subunit ribosomal protein S13
MVRLIGIDLPRNKKIEYALTCIYGIGIISAKKFVKLSNIDPNIRINSLQVNQIKILRKIIEKSGIKLEGELRRFNGLNIKRLSDINCYKGKRHRNKLPVRGQRTRTNSRTNRKLLK